MIPVRGLSPEGQGAGAVMLVRTAGRFRLPREAQIAAHVAAHVAAQAEKLFRLRFSQP